MSDSPTRPARGSPRRASPMPDRFGHLRVLGVLGAGGMGVVLEALDERLDRRVAVKILPRDLAMDPDARERLEREARAIAALDHPGIVAIHSIEEHDGTLLLILERVMGRSLRDAIPANGLPVATLLDWGLQLADAVGTAHAGGIIHRDLKPGNVMVTDSGRIKVLDFGIARMEGVPRAAAAVTQAGDVLGTPAYMSPEQVAGQPSDARSDVWGLGVLLHEMATGSPPFEGDTAGALAASILRDPPAPLRRARPDLPPALEQLVERCLEKDPARRPQSAAEVRSTLVALRAGRHERRRSRQVATLAVVAVVAVVVGAALVARQVARTEGSATAPEAASVVVLPCQVFGPDEAQFLTDAVPATLSSFLGRVPGLDARRPPTSLQADPANLDLARIAKAYGINRCVTCAISSEQSGLHLAVQLVEPATGRILWSDSRDGTRDGYLALVKEAADGLSRQLRPASVLPPARPVDAGASQAELELRRARHFLDRYNNLRLRSDYEAARDSLDRALHLDPKLAVAVADRALLMLWGQGELAEVERLARSALAIDRSCARAWAALAYVANDRADYRQAAACALESLRHDPREVLAIFVLGNSCSTLSGASGRHGVEVDPLYVWGLVNAGMSLIEVGRDEEALHWLQAALEQEPAHADGNFFLVLTLLELGRASEARAALPRLTGDRPFLMECAALCVDLETGDAAAQARAADRIGELAQDESLGADAKYVVLYYLVPAAARHGRVDMAAEALRASVRQGRVPYYDWLMLNPHLEAVRQRPGFDEVAAASRAQLTSILGVFGDARARGELPAFLEPALADLAAKVRLEWPPRTAP